MNSYIYEGRRPIQVVDRQLKEQFGSDIIGVSITPTQTIVHTDVPKSSIDNAIAAINSLTVTTDKTEILANGTDVATITAAVPESDFYFIAYLNDDIYDEGYGSSVSGVATLELDTDIAGVYTVHVLRTGGTYATGSVIITAEEV